MSDRIGSKLFESLGRGVQGTATPSAVPSAPPGKFSGSVSTGAAAAIAPLGSAQLAYFDPYERPIPGAVEFNVTGGNAQNLNALGRVMLAPLSGPSLAPWNDSPAGNAPLITLPPNSFCRISGFRLYLQDTDETTNTWPVYWSLVVNGQTVPGYTMLPYFQRTSALYVDTYTPYVRLTGQTQIQVNVFNASAATINSGKIGCAVSGWYWTTAADVQWKNQFGVPLDPSEAK